MNSRSIGHSIANHPIITAIGFVLAVAGTVLTLYFATLDDQWLAEDKDWRAADEAAIARQDSLLGQIQQDLQAILQHQEKHHPTEEEAPDD